MPLEDLPSASLAQLVRALRQELEAVRQTLGEALATALARISVLEQELAEARGGGPPKTPANSSVPPAKGWKASRRPPRGTEGERPKRGPKRGHVGVSRRRVAPAGIDVVVACRPSHCAQCGHALPTTGGKIVGRKQVTELPPPRPVVLEAQRWRVRCPHCQARSVGHYPEGYGTLGAFGPRLLATVALLHEEHHVAYDRLVGLLQTVFGVVVSEGALVEAVGRVGQALQPAAAAIGAEVRQAAVVGSDETSARVDGVNYWEWVFQTETAAYHTIQRRRNTEVVLSFLGEAKPEVWVSDLWKPQLAAPSAAYQICLAHQLRDLQYAIDAERGPSRRAARAWAEALAALMREAIHLRHEQGAAPESMAFWQAVAGIEATCATLLATPLPPGWSADLQTRFRVHRAGLWTFLYRPDVPPTNNASERSLRPSVVHRKVTGGFRSDWGAQGYAALRTVADTARKRGQDLFGLLLDTLGPHLPLAAHYVPP